MSVSKSESERVKRMIPWCEIGKRLRQRMSLMAPGHEVLHESLGPIPNESPRKRLPLAPVHFLLTAIDPYHLRAYLSSLRLTSLYN